MNDDMKDWSYPLGDEQARQPPAWYEDDREYQLERLQDRLDRYVSAMKASDKWRGVDSSYMINAAMELIRAVDKAAQQEIENNV